MQDSGQTVEWQETLADFEALFPQPPDAKDVRNWNSVHGRRKHYRGWKQTCTKMLSCQKSLPASHFPNFRAYAHYKCNG
eukprot:2210605-Amphidinium_carterae.1